MAMAIYALIVSAIYTALYVCSKPVAQALLILFVALLLVPAVAYETLFVKRLRRRSSDR